MPIVQPSLFKLLGAGFLADRYAADGVHLRWMFDHRLGFPRDAVCLYRRPALGSREANAAVRWRIEKVGDFGPITQLDREGMRLRREDGAAFDSQGGIALSAAPLWIEWTSPPPSDAACYVRIHVRVLDPGGSARAVAEYVQRGIGEPVDRDRVAFSKRPERFNLADLLRKPVASAISVRPTLDRRLGSLLTRGDERGRKLESEAQKSLYAHLLRIDPAVYRDVSPQWLAEVSAALDKERVAVVDLVKDGVYRDAELIVRADRIDRVVLTGARARVTAVAWVTSDAYVVAKGWERVACVPAAGGNLDYLARNKEHFGGRTPGELAEARVFGRMPNGAEPLDEPVFPPTRPPTHQERTCRYLVPWTKTFADWYAGVLDESAGGLVHMAQVTRQIPMTDFGQRPGEPMPQEAEGSTIEVKPYPMLLAASTAFPVAQLLGLAHIDTADVKLASAGQDTGTWDYLAIARWQPADIAAWARKLMADLAEAGQRAQQASPAEKLAAQVALMEKMFAILSAVGEINALLASVEGEVFTLCSLKLGLRLQNQPDFVGPASVTPTFEEASVVEPGMGIVRVDWPLRQRARAEHHEGIPVGACVARGEDGGPLQEVLNPVMPEQGDCKDVRAALLPAGPAGAAGAAGTASHTDRALKEGVKVRYGVSEMDPFGRWSPFTEAPFLWEDRSAPPPPASVQASLEAVDVGLRLRVVFHWDRVLLPPNGYAFHVGLRRDTALSGGAVWPDDAADRAHWTRLSRALSGAAGALRFLGSDPSGFTTLHDGLHVTVSFVNTSVPDGAGGSAPRRVYTVDLVGGLEVLRDAFLRARVYVGVASERLSYGVMSDVVAGPAIAEHTDPAVPEPPAFPPDPLSASFADAEGFSTLRLAWNGLANTRYQVLRASERELVSAIGPNDARASAWEAATTVAERAAALRSMGSDLRQVFAPVSPWLPEVPLASRPGVGKLPTPPSIPAASRSHVDRLPGRADTLFVYAVVARSASGEPSPWPSGPAGFVAVRVPVAAPPSQPVVLRATWQPPMDTPPAVAVEGMARAELTVAFPSAGPTPGAYEIYRTADPAAAGDERRMRRVHVAAPVWEDTADGLDVARFVDPTVQPWQTYWYTLVARAGTPVSPGIRSSASRPVAVATAAPSAPAAPVLGAPAVGGGSVSVTADVDFPTARLDEFRVEVWRTNTSPHQAVPATVTAAGPSQLQVVLDAAQVVPASTMVLRVRDPLGRVGSSVPWPIP